MARLDRLGSARDIAQIGATIGRNFSYELLAAVTDLDRRDLRPPSTGSRTRGSSFAKARLRTQAIYYDALVQDAAYGTLLRGPRQRLHAQIANVLEGSFRARQCGTRTSGPPSHGGGSNKTRRLILVESGASRC